jgi:hypothetical protein
MRSVIFAGLAAFAMISPSAASDCGSMPQMPAHFDPASAGKEDIMRLKAEFEAFKVANTQFIECLKSGATSVKEKNLIESTISAEQKFAKRFNANAKQWVKNQSRQS